jgi:hypothetical protein
MLSFKKLAKNKYLSPANIQLNLGVSPPRNSKSISPLYQNDKKNSYSISISPDKPEKTINTFSSHNLKKTINTFSSHNLKKTINNYYNNPKLNLMKKITMFKNNMKNTLFNKDKPIYRHLDLGKSPPRKIEQTRPQLFGAKLYPASSIKINSNIKNSNIKISKKKSLINSKKNKINSKKK